MKLFKSEPKEKPKKTKGNDTDDEDDDNNVEGDQTDDAVVEYEPVWLRLTNSSSTDEKQSRTPKVSAVSGCNNKERPILAAGLKFAKDIYGLGKISPSPETRAFYENYVNAGGYKFNAEDWLQHKPTLLTDLNIPSPTQDANARPPIFTTDDVFVTCMPEVSKSSLKFYQQSFVTAEDYFAKVDNPVFNAYPSVF
ncbi:hypothetical protein OESDEN_13538 [Oesophagostomum dentatum]|uniref:Uncharacterized protein n=1 Tax=Oesophagostomum dentatum TaxID=61180 RepID=A0A0B1ST70_OESDE|nr:hypothetical protein OESDEN_13538 [Oesophagostomum dentatum]